MTAQTEITQNRSFGLRVYRQFCSSTSFWY